MQQVSPKRPITYTVENEDFKGVTVELQPLTQPQRAKLLGHMNMSGQNIGEIAVEWCNRHIVGWSGLDVEFTRKGALDEFPAELMIEVVAALALGSKVTETDAGN